jgi:hypothetical protein
MIPEQTICNQSKCIKKMNCRRFKDWLNSVGTNPIKFNGNKKQHCENYIPLKLKR